jgi:uncharacterized membrane protein HdeD (DUF308 family)
VGLIVLRFDYTSVSAISLLFGFVAIGAGVMELTAMFLAAGWWKLLNIILAIVFIVVGIVAFIHPGDTFKALAAVFSFFLIFAGTFDIIISISARTRSRCVAAAVGGIIEQFLASGGRLLRSQRSALLRGWWPSR